MRPIYHRARRRGRPRKDGRGFDAAAIIAENRQQNEKKVQLETYRRSLDQVAGEGNYNDPRLIGGIDWSSITFTHPSYKHIKRKQQFKPDMKVPPNKIIDNSVGSLTGGTSSKNGKSSKSGKKRKRHGIEERSRFVQERHNGFKPLFVQLNPSMAELEKAREELEIEYLANGGLGDLKPNHLLIRRYIAENSPEVIVAHADRVARISVKAVLQRFPTDRTASSRIVVPMAPPDPMAPAK